MPAVLFWEEGSIRSTDKCGSVAGGFVIDGNGSSVRVLRPSVVSLSGLDPEPRALLVRVVRAPDARYQARRG